MSEVTTGREIDPRGVNHPKHYNTHPSGVEAIEVCRHLNFNLGSAFKYVYRRNDKADAGLTQSQSRAKNLDKAIWYVRDEYLHMTDLKELGIPALSKVIAGEESSHARAVYRCFTLLTVATSVEEYKRALRATEVKLIELKSAED